ncbi:hypothetical protein [Sphingobacterium sp. UBA3549]|uniref:hypothetical protein n=1 Tax=Sphingobacterium sp. UBA3549 TaxID=1947496 RepID=UPI0025D2340F|nr:hypothetical protein [Sphingobacterium sp. UBA3549]
MKFVHHLHIPVILTPFGYTIHQAKQKLMETPKEGQLVTYPIKEDKQQITSLDFEETSLYSNWQSDNF